MPSTSFSVCCTSGVLTPVCYTPTGIETEEETEQAFQRSVHGDSDPALNSTTVQLTAAVHDMDIDHLLQKLICGEIEYNPHDPNWCVACREGLTAHMACTTKPSLFSCFI